MQTIQSLSDLTQYLNGISKRMKHHGAHWRPVVQTIAFELQSKLASGAPLDVRTYNGAMAVQIRLTLRNGRQIKVTYHSSQQAISIRDAQTQRTIHTFAPTDPIETVARKCRQLGVRRRRSNPSLRLVA